MVSIFDPQTPINQVGDIADQATDHRGVGYAKPPAEHRFGKGQSRNPGERLKGAVNKPKINAAYGQKATAQYLREEAQSAVALREGGKDIWLPAIQAEFRAVGVSAVRQRFAQRTRIELVTRRKADDHQSKIELIGTYVEYKHRF